MKINEYFIKIRSSKTVFTNALEIGQEVLFAGKGSVVKIEDEDNFDGTIDKTYIIKPEFAEDMTYKERV